MKLLVLFHCGNIEIAKNILKKYPVLHEEGVYTFVTCHDMKTKLALEELFKKQTYIQIIPNQGCDIGGFMMNLHAFNNSPYVNDAFDAVAIIHTKSHHKWRDVMLDGMLKDLPRNIEYFKKTSRPCIIGASGTRFPLFRFLNLEFLEPVLDTHKDLVLDTEYIDIPSIEHKHEFKFNLAWYCTYETDMRGKNKHAALSHFRNNGKNEHHRIINPCMLSKTHSKLGFFIAGTMFLCNIDYLKLWSKVDVQKEFALLETGYVRNNVPRRTHFWEYAHGLICYTNGGIVVGSNPKELNDTQNDIYKTLPLRAIMMAKKNENSLHVALVWQKEITTDDKKLAAALEYMAMILREHPNILLDIYHSANTDCRQAFHVLNSYKIITQWDRVNIIGQPFNQRTLIYDTAFMYDIETLRQNHEAKFYFRLIYDDGLGIMMATNMNIAQRDAQPQTEVNNLLYPSLSEAQLKAIIPNNISSLALIASYTDKPIIPTYIIKYAEELKKHFNLVILLTNKRDITAESLNEANKYTHVIKVPNENLDFGMWARVLLHFNLENFPALERVLLTNDSVELVNKETFNDVLKGKRGSVWGLTDSPYIQHHLQSYFIVFDTREAIQHMLAFFKRKRWDEMKSFDKTRIIDLCELGLSSYMSACYTLNAVYKFDDIVKIPTQTDLLLEATSLYNPSYFFWDKLVRLKCPLIKRRKLFIDGEDYCTERLPISGMHVLSHSNLFIAK